MTLTLQESGDEEFYDTCLGFLRLEFFSVQFEDSEDDFDRFDTDDELSYRRDSVYSCVTLPYFHSFLHIKGKTDFLEDDLCCRSLMGLRVILKSVNDTTTTIREFP